MAISLVAMAAATLILFLDEVFELIEARISFIYFPGSLVLFTIQLILQRKKILSRYLTIIP